MSKRNLISLAVVIFFTIFLTGIAIAGNERESKACDTTGTQS